MANKPIDREPDSLEGVDFSRFAEDMELPVGGIVGEVATTDVPVTIDVATLRREVAYRKWVEKALDIEPGL